MIISVRGEKSVNVYNCFPGGKFKALTMSYDDGVESDIRLIEIFDKYGIKGTFNVNAGLASSVGKHSTRIPLERIKEVYQGHEVATHCYTHPTIARCPLVEVAAEILKDRDTLEKVTGGLVRGHAYPNGSYSDDIKDLFKMLGIAYGRVTRPDPSGLVYQLPKDPLEWRPTSHHNDSDLMERAKWLAENQSKQYLRLMYVWGHSWQFDRDNNWEVIEEFCKYMGGREDIWYATNIEIIDYMEVLERLKFSANGECVYNPSAKSAWLEIDDERFVEVPGGAYVNLAEERANLSRD